MATQLIKHLIDCAAKDAVYKPLEAQWAFDERLVAKALQSVGNYFPHYSRHDESHSRQILVHIERLLGEENIAQLTATDTWLLLEAAYLHDIGMVISDEHLNTDFDEIKKHVEKNRHTANGDTLTLMNAVLASKEKTASAIFAKVDIHPFRATKLLREIIADFYRVKHPDRADRIISDPFLEIGLDSPRNELLPSRFFSLLGKICAYHGKPFAEVMQLPKQQVGIGTDDCHPRFIACLLRLGDLLDLDDNRFCPVMLKMAGELPDLSKAHLEKHLAIRHFRADRERIEIEADCPSYDSYIETNKWFGWLREEVKNQMSLWFDIVPSRNFGLLPSVGDLKAHLKDWQVFSENQRPQFNLDRDRIFELLQGAGLYESKEQAMRELLQNAVDATLIRIWREHGEDCMPKSESFIERNSAPRSENVRKILDKYSIDVTIEKEKEEDQYNYWRITIADQGTGISKEDLKFMMQMGSSKKNHKRRAIIEKMPVWMKPSGIFGIGLHSVFLLTDEVIIETRSIDTGETLVIRLTNPTNEKEHGNVYFQVISEPKTIELENEKKQEFKPWGFSRYGCQLSFIYKTDKTTFPSYQLDGLVDIKIRNYDGLIDATDDFYILKISEYIFNYFELSYIKGKSYNCDFYPSSFDEQDFYHYSENNSLEIIGIYSNSMLSCFFYRGQKITNIILQDFNLFKVSVNLLDSDADIILTINRNNLKNDVKNQIKERVRNSIQEIFNSEKWKTWKPFCENYKDIEVRIAAEYKLQGWKLPSYIKQDEWENFKIQTNLGLKNIKSLDDFDTILCFYENTHCKLDLDEFLKNYPESEKTIYIPQDRNQFFNYGLLHDFIKNKNFSSTYLEYDKFELVKITRGQSDENPISEDMIRLNCNELIEKSEKYIFRNILKRLSIPCLKEYSSLALKQQDLLPKLNSNNFNWIDTNFTLDFISPRMLFPLARIGDKITVGDLNILAKRVYKNRADENTTEEQIKEKYQEFIAYLDDLMKEDTEWVKLRGEEFKPNRPHGTTPNSEV